MGYACGFQRSRTTSSTGLQSYHVFFWHQPPPPKSSPRQQEWQRCEEHALQTEIRKIWSCMWVLASFVMRDLQICFEMMLEKPVVGSQVRAHQDSSLYNCNHSTPSVPLHQIQETAAHVLQRLCGYLFPCGGRLLVNAEAITS